MYTCGRGQNTGTHRLVIVPSIFFFLSPAENNSRMIFPFPAPASARFFLPHTSPIFFAPLFPSPSSPFPTI